jgi:hypothetical protein
MMAAIRPLVFVLALGNSAAANAGPVRMVVADVPYARVWAAALEAVGEYPIERIAEGDIVTGWRERPARPEEQGFERVADRVRLQVEVFGERITRISVIAEVRGWRDGGWISLGEAGPLERDVLARIRAGLS